MDNNPNDDNSVMSMHENTMTLLDIFSGDSVLVRGKRKKETVLVCISDASCDEGKVRVNGGIRKNLGVKLGDVVGIHKVDNLPYGTKVSVLLCPASRYRYLSLDPVAPARFACPAGRVAAVGVVRDPAHHLPPLNS